MKPLHDKQRTSMQNLVASVANYWGIPFALMFSQSWGGAFKTAPMGNAFTVGDRLSPQFDTALDELDRYYGLQLHTVRTEHAEMLLPRVEESLRQELPVMIYLDHYWTPWMPGYRRRHKKELVLLTGVQKAGGVLRCVDPKNRIWQGELTPQQFIRGNDGIGAFFIRHSNTRSFELDAWKRRLRRKLLPLQCPSVFDSLRALAEAVEADFDIDREAAPGGKEGIWHSPLIKNMLLMSRGRFCFSLAACDIAARYDVAEYEGFARDMQLAAREWEAICHMLVRLFYNRQTGAQQLVEIAGRIRLLADLEQGAAERYAGSGISNPARTSRKAFVMMNTAGIIH